MSLRKCHVQILTVKIERLLEVEGEGWFQLEVDPNDSQQVKDALECADDNGGIVVVSSVIEDQTMQWGPANAQDSE